MRRRLIYATIILGSANAAYNWHQKQNGTTFINSVRLVFPDYLQNKESGTNENRTVKIVSMNQLQYLLKQCSEHGKTIAPSCLENAQTDVFYDNSPMNEMLKLDPKHLYCKIQSGMTIP